MAINQLSKQFKSKYSLECQISSHSYLECVSALSHFKNSTLEENLIISMKEGSISLPLRQLVLH
jgi:hypothetical protein